MAEPFLGEIRMMSFNFAPKGWATCSGQTLPINQNQALFALLGTMYGGDARVNFKLPDLRGRATVHVGDGSPPQGASYGETAHALTQQEMPQHIHGFVVDNTGPAGTQGNVPASTKRISGSNPGELYGPASNLSAMSPAAITNVGGSQPHENMMPYTVIGFCIALQGIFPSPN